MTLIDPVCCTLNLIALWRLETFLDRLPLGLLLRLLLHWLHIWLQLAIILLYLARAVAKSLYLLRIKRPLLLICLTSDGRKCRLCLHRGINRLYLRHLGLVQAWAQTTRLREDRLFIYAMVGPYLINSFGLK